MKANDATRIKCQADDDDLQFLLVECYSVYFAYIISSQQSTAGQEHLPIFATNKCLIGRVWLTYITLAKQVGIDFYIKISFSHTDRDAICFVSLQSVATTAGWDGVALCILNLIPDILVIDNMKSDTLNSLKGASIYQFRPISSITQGTRR